MRVEVMAAVLGTAVTISCASRVVDFLPDNHCGSSEVLLADLSGARISAMCGTDGTTRSILVSTENRHRPGYGPLLAFSLGFCGSEVISVEAPRGWKASVDGSIRSFHVTWEVSADVGRDRGIPSGQRMSGFVVRLRPGWRRTGSSSARWESGAEGTTVTHDECEQSRSRVNTSAIDRNLPGGGRRTIGWIGRRRSLRGTPAPT
jgi:hypothetical protein